MTDLLGTEDATCGEAAESGRVDAYFCAGLAEGEEFVGITGHEWASLPRSCCYSYCITAQARAIILTLRCEFTDVRGIRWLVGHAGRRQG